jgi:16S rRNA (uracil1498-N3)-methyltransferase
MRVPRIFTTQALAVGRKLVLQEAAQRHLIQVLRLRPGMELTLFNGDGKEYAAQLETCTKKTATAEILALQREEPVAPLAIHLVIGVSKGERMDFALQKSVELGVSEITPLFSERCTVRLHGERLEKRLQHWRNVTISACEQSGRCRVPQIHEPCPLEGCLGRPGLSPGILLDHRATQTLPELEQPPAGAVSLLIGPEGGLSEQERNLAQAQDFTAVRMGPRIMRTETVPLAALAAIQLLWGDFR